LILSALETKADNVPLSGVKFNDALPARNMTAVAFMPANANVRRQATALPRCQLITEPFLQKFANSRFHSKILNFFRNPRMIPLPFFCIPIGGHMQCARHRPQRWQRMHLLQAPRGEQFDAASETLSHQFWMLTGPSAPGRSKI
jgi:hypothetical protein